MRRDNFHAVKIASAQTKQALENNLILNFKTQFFIALQSTDNLTFFGVIHVVLLVYTHSF